MNFNNLNIIVDRRINGLSISATITIGDYMNWFLDHGLANKLEDQRPVMKSRTANMIRKRLVEDLKLGAVIPPIVIGFAIEDALNTIKDANINDILENNINNATIIDGMQRSEALREAIDSSPEISDNDLRLDIWITPNAISLIYRMLVLNTGQTPWDVKRQMEVVYKPLINECKSYVDGIRINTRNDGKRRSSGGEYRASDIVELFLAFSSRKVLINTAEKLADDFTRLDVTQMAGSQEYSHIFYECIKMLFRFDVAISKYEGQQEEQIEGDKINDGIGLFTNLPAKVGFVVALAQHILGRAGSMKSDEEQKELLQRTTEKFYPLCDKIDAFNQDELCNFLSLGVLNDSMKSLSVKKIGDDQRRFFEAGFNALFSSDCDIKDMEIVWRAY
ncbi:hypothetical protein [Segatella bryantii]|uniref:DUF262 domain-containing protein n=1 Tax=Segatella bryantii TaxID=77095 RepID=A0ABX4EE50_SEGBR|nr:hypothetical protein [Segatella bryantii]OYP53178.1 hypothetical protein CIK91_13325 [Segatella bryantii]UKK80525.1 hypothetical protein L6474_07630 [Segatella bryantii]